MINLKALISLSTFLKKSLSTLVMVLFITTCGPIHASTAQPSALAATAPGKEQIYRVKRVVDGDTIVLDNGEKIRLIGVDTPETKHPKKPVQYFGKEASAFTKKEIEGRQVRIEYDWQRTDRYQRTLAYVYRLPDNFFLNAELIKQGYGHAYTRFPFKYLDEFRKYEKEARESNKGLWRPQ